VAICERAMAREIAKRYPDMQALAADLSAYLEHRVVAAYETGAWAEARKWVQRNKPLAASLAAAVMLLVGGLLTSLWFKERADENAKLAAENAAEARDQARIAQANAERATRQEQIATQRANDVLSLSASKDLEDLVARAERLWPPHPELVDDYERWLVDASALIDGRAEDLTQGVKKRPSLAEHQSKLAELRQRALPLTQEEALAERESHPRYGELAPKSSELTWRSRMLFLEPWPDEAEIEAALALEALPADANGLNSLAWPLVDPDQRVYGEEMKGLLLAQRAVAAASAAERAGIRDTLAWAHFSVGRLQEALDEERLALEEAPEAQKQEFAGYVAKLEAAVAGWQGDAALAARRSEREALLAEVASLEQALSERRSFEFEDPEDEWWHVQLSKLVADIEALRDPEQGLLHDVLSEPFGWGVTKRFEFARTINERSVEGPVAQGLWGEAIESIATSPHYGGLALGPQMGLLPIGPDPESGLWEFAHLMSGAAAVRGADGKLSLTEETGLVLVLIPGGRFWMGAQNEPGEQNHDPLARGDEGPVHEVELSAYLLSKYEMTQGQLQRMAGENPSYYHPPGGVAPTLLHPVEQVSWTQCMALMERVGLVLPSEAQWERGARGGTDTPWWTGADRESLRGKVNLADQTAKQAGATWGDINDWPDLEDGSVVHSEVGRYAPNAFGLHEVAGNVWEWCLDGFDFGFYGRSPEKDPVSPPAGSSSRVNRGGSFDDAASRARSADRGYGAPVLRGNSLGLRPAKGITP
jgi:formylglycine-generating enzyme required for sulfatase activity